MAGVKVQGLRELEAALADMGKATARNVLMRALKPRGARMVAAMQASVPVDEGEMRTGIVASVRRPAKMDPGKQAYAQAIASGGGDKKHAAKAMRNARRNNPANFAALFVGVQGPRKSVAHIVEWGTSTQPGTRFATRAWDTEGPGLLDGVTDDIKAEIEKAKVRAARKAARLLAKAGG